MLIFCRHGETILNKENRLQGLSDSPLTEKGIQYAHSLGSFFAKLDLQKIYLSPLPRVVQTFGIANKSINFSAAIISAELKEMCYGEWEGLSKDELKKHPVWKKRNEDRFNFVHPGSYEGIKGESYHDLFVRLTHFFRELSHKDTTNDTVVVSHLGVMRCAVKFYLHLSDLETGALEIPNSDVLLFTQKKDSTFSLEKIVL